LNEFREKVIRGLIKSPITMGMFAGLEWQVEECGHCGSITLMTFFKRTKKSNDI
jgi:hypothetical protein